MCDVGSHFWRILLTEHCPGSPHSSLAQDPAEFYAQTGQNEPEVFKMSPETRDEL